jgi:PTS system fructose-specific IIC component
VKIVAVTSCPTGIAHTYMAAEALEQAGLAAGHEIVVETQGAAGAVPLTPEQIAAADVVVFAADVEVRGRERFAGIPTVAVGVKRAINDAASLVREAETVATVGRSASRVSAPAVSIASPHLGVQLRQWLMTGVSYMIPFVAAGGILIALGFLFGGDEVVTKLYGGTFHGVDYKAVAGAVPSGIDPQAVIHQAGYAGLLFALGKFAFFMLVPVLSGFIAYAMADRQGLVPGVVGGLLASAIGAGFLGGLASGLLAGAVVLAIGRLRVPRAMAGIMPVVIVPLVSTIVVGFAVLLVLNKPITSATTHLTSALQNLSGHNAVLLGLVLGLMMAFDMGGPVNKVAYTFGLASLSAGNTQVMAAVMAAGMTPPIAMALATVVRPKLFSDAERKAGEAGWLLGASFITEGAIPFAAADPLRVIPSLMAGSAVTGALSMAFHASSRAPHGGIFVVGLVGKPVLYLVAIVAGVLVSAAVVIASKTASRRVITLPTDEPARAVAPVSVSA